MQLICLHVQEERNQRFKASNDLKEASMDRAQRILQDSLLSTRAVSEEHAGLSEDDEEHLQSLGSEEG